MFGSLDVIKFSAHPRWTWYPPCSTETTCVTAYIPLLYYSCANTLFCTVLCSVLPRLRLGSASALKSYMLPLRYHGIALQYSSTALKTINMISKVKPTDRRGTTPPASRPSLSCSNTHDTLFVSSFDHSVVHRCRAKCLQSANRAIPLQQ